MKVKIKKIDFDKVASLPPKKQVKPKKCRWYWRWLLNIISFPELAKVRFKSTKIGMEKLPKKQPCLILMNHCSSIDLQIAATIMGSRPVNIVCTIDSLLGKDWLMRQIGCIPTDKFVKEVQIVRDIYYALHTLKTSVVMFPEAGYSIDGKASLLPESVGKLIKLLKVPVVMITTFGAYTRDPLYSCLKITKGDVSAQVKYLLSQEDVEAKSVQELNQIVGKEFDFDYYNWQKENKVAVKSKNRAYGLNKVLYKCPNCLQEGNMHAEGTTLKCLDCGKEYQLTEYGELQALNGQTEYSHIPDWSAWEREQVKKELLDGSYKVDIPVKIGIIKNTKCLYMVGNGRLVHDLNGFELIGCDGKLHYIHTPLATHSIVADFFFYETEDMVCIGDKELLYFCYPEDQSKDIVYKMRLAHEELYKIKKGLN